MNCKDHLETKERMTGQKMERRLIEVTRMSHRNKGSQTDDSVITDTLTQDNKSHDSEENCS